MVSIAMDMPKIITQFNILNFNNHLVVKITKQLEKLILSNALKANVEFRHFEPYWKFPEITLCFFYIYSDEWILVKDFVKIFGVKFSYSSVPVYTSINSINCHYTSESAVWSSNVDKNIFLDENVTWVHIYNNAIDLNLKCDFELND